MPNINLLPWREQLREERTREYLIILGGSAIATVAVLLLFYALMRALVSDQLVVNDMLRQEIAFLDQQIQQIKSLQEEKAELVARMDIVQSLQVTRPLVVRMFDELVRILPPGVYLTKMDREGNRIILHGKAESNTRVSALMRNIERSDWLTEPVLTEIKKQQEGGQVRDFELMLQEKSQQQPEGANEFGVTDDIGAALPQTGGTR